MLNPLPFHNFAAGAAEAAMAANAQGKFWQMHDLLFAHQQGGLDRAHLDGYAKELGLNMEKFKHDVDTNAYAAQIKQDQDLMQQLGMGGTPAFFINGKKLSGAQPAANFEKIIDAEIQHANQLIAQGVKPEDVYAEIMKTARTSPAPTAAAAPNKPQQQPPAQVRKVELGDAYVKGPKDAKVTILEFSDFQ